MKKRRFPFLRPVNPRVPKRVFLGWSKKRESSTFQMGITGAPFGPIGMKICPTTPAWWALARKEGPGVPGGWGVAKQLENVRLFGHYFLNFWEKWKKMTKSVKFARIELILIQNESPHRVLDSWGVLANFSKKTKEKMEIRKLESWIQNMTAEIWTLKFENRTL